MTTDRPPPKPEANRDRQARIEAQREAKLAQALRANLRRRKAEPAAKPGPNDGDSG